MVARIERALLSALCALLAVALALAVLDLPTADGGLRDRVLATLPQSGVANPVTAVLLNHRGFDTLLETAVLLFAVVASWSLLPREPGRPHRPRHPEPPDPALVLFARALAPVGVLVAIHLFWTGADAPGGAFQAGTVLAAVVLLLLQAGVSHAQPARPWVPRALLVLGTGAFLGVGAAGAAATGAFLGFPPAAAKGMILAIEAALTVSVAATLVMLALGPREDRT